MPLFRREPIGQDSLTGLLDREAFIERCDAFSERGSEVALAEISLVFLDVHNLKDFNAREGIDRGDDVLKVIAGELRKRFPKGFAARYSVDCFLVMATIGVVPEMVDAINHQLPSFGEAGGLLVKAGYVAYRRGFGAAVGMAFQIRDDMLDALSSEAELGKPIGSDAAEHKNTYMVLLGEKACEQLVDRLTDEACACLRSAFSDTMFLEALATKLAKRNH
jgi:GGDEF domain-containing protein